MTKLKPILPILAMGLLSLVFFWKILLTNLILVGIDVFLYFYPYRAYATQALLSGRFPLWNPHIFMGVPFLANSQAGLLYPPNWLFLWADAPKQIAYSIGLHIWLAGLGAYYFARHSLRLEPLSAFVGAMVFALSGFLGAQVEHINQLQVSAWLPWVFLLYDQICQPLPSLPRSWSSLCTPTFWGQSLAKFWAARGLIACLGLVIALMLLAGHTQSVYISLFGLGIYALARRGLPGDRLQTFTAWGLDRLIYLCPLVAAILLAGLLSAVQLLPTLELSQHSLRSGGLTYNEVVSFSLKPTDLIYTIFPPYGIDLEAKLGPAFSEFVAYVGIIPLALVLVGLIYHPRSRQQEIWALGLTGGVGFILALGLFSGPLYVLLYRYVPGFDLFRVPARWLLLYTFALAMLAALGFNRLKAKLEPARIGPLILWKPILACLIPLELFIAAQGLRYNKPTAAEAHHFLRPAITKLQTVQTPTDRFLSLSDTRYDPGDLREIQTIYGDQLSERAIYDYVVAAKQKEVLSFNLPMVFGLQAIDGYDGGLLPLKKFLDIQRLFLEEDNLSLDGRLREKLSTIPPTRLLSLLGVRHVITDKVHDVWLDHVFYDLQFPAILSPDGPAQVWTEDIPPLSANAIGLVFQTRQSGTVAELVVRTSKASGGLRSKTFPLSLENSQPWSERDYYIVFEGLSGEAIAAIGIVAKADIIIRALSLINQDSVTSRSVILSTQGHYRFIHGGDVKIYENLAVLPRAFIVHQAEIVTEIKTAIHRLQDPTFDLSQRFIRLAKTDEKPQILRMSPGSVANVATITTYKPEQVIIQAKLEAPGWLILTDTHYPGWRVWVDGVEAEILEANLMFRAVALSAGKHELVFKYRPALFFWGLGLSLLGSAIFVMMVIKKTRKPTKNFHIFALYVIIQPLFHNAFTEI